MNRRVYDEKIFNMKKLENDINEIWMMFGLIKYNLSNELYYDGINITINSEKVKKTQILLYEKLNKLFSNPKFPKTKDEFDENYYYGETEEKIFFKKKIYKILLECVDLDILCLEIYKEKIDGFKNFNNELKLIN